MKITQKGITLVALVITIIILLILAGISISALTNTGIFQKARDAEGKSKLADAKESMTLLLHEWQMEHVTSDKTLETFLGEKVADSTIEDYNKLDNGNYEVYIKGHVGKLDKDGNLIGEVEKAGPRPTVSNITIKSEDGKTEIADHSQKPGTKLQIDFNTGIENGTIKSVTPAVPYETNGTEKEVTFTVVGTVDGTDYTSKKTISVASKYQPFTGTTVEEAIKYGGILNASKNTELKDAKNNKIVVPAGFKIVSNADTNNATTVDKGIVIEDTSGNQFVWIPVGTITKTGGSTEKIALNRYTFAEDGTPTAQNDNVIETYYQEKTTGSGNTVAKDINAFKTSVTTNEGYYIGRYEARKDSSDKLTEIGSNNVYNFITQPNAATACRNMYTSTKFTSDLMNSYAWDTAIVFLQKCGDNPTYSRKTTVIISYSTTGRNNQTTKDVQCNVFDMASNLGEWTTETSSNSRGSCTGRGGIYRGVNFYTSIRDYNSTSVSNDYTGFRPLLYVNV